MSFVDTDTRREIRDAARSLLASHPARALADALEEGVAYDAELWTQAAGLGWTGVLVPEERDGIGLDLQDAAALVGELGRALQSGPFLDAIVLTALLVRHGSEAQQAETLPSLADGTVRPSLALEGQVRLAAGRDGWCLDGTVTFVPHAGASDLLVVEASREGAPVLVLVATDRPGVTVARQETLDLTRRYAEVTFASVAVTEASVLDDPEAVRLGQDLQRALLCAETVSAAQTLFEMTLQYAATRVQFDRPIASFQAIKHRCADMRIALDAMAAATDHAVMVLAAGEPATFATQVAKGFVSDRAPWLAGEALQIFGGIGMTWEHDLHLFLRRIRVNSLMCTGKTSAYGQLVAAVL